MVVLSNIIIWNAFFWDLVYLPAAVSSSKTEDEEGKDVKTNSSYDVVGVFPLLTFLGKLDKILDLRILLSVLFCFRFLTLRFANNLICLFKEHFLKHP